MSEPLPGPGSSPEERARILRARNRALAFGLVFFVALFFAITLVRMKL